jgi:hypothetical protein
MAIWDIALQCCNYLEISLYHGIAIFWEHALVP